MGIPYIIQKLIDPIFQKKICKRFGDLIKSPYHIYPNYLTKNSIIYSGGIGGGISFEMQVSKEFNSKIFLFDPTPTGAKTMTKIPDKNMSFVKLALADYSGNLNLSSPKNPKEGSYTMGGSLSFPCTSLRDFMKKKGHKKIDLLKIDIEGAEYMVINDILKNKIPVSQIAVELHHRFKGIGYLKTIILIKNLYKAGYKLIYKNIDDYTFIKRELLSKE